MFDIPEVRRRSSERRLARIPCEAVRAEGFTAVGGTLLDLGSTGMLLEAWAGLVSGEEVYLSFRAPRTMQWIGLVARVERVVQAVDHGRCLAGLAITEIDPVERAILRASIERLPPRPAGRRALRDYARWVASIAGLEPSPSVTFH